MKESRNTYKSLGVVLVVFLVLYGIARQYIFLPLLGKLWGLTLMTTPQGFVSEHNIVDAILKSPWIILIALILIIIYTLIAIWPISAIIVGIEYARRGKKIKLGDLINISLVQLRDRDIKKDWMMVVYGLVILPIANVYHVSDMIGSFVIPEYIQDFINAKPFLFIIFIALIVLIVYIAIRWEFIYPSFILKGKDFKEAKEESKLLTQKRCIKNAINIAIYAIIEFVRLSILPIVFILVPVFVCYACTITMPYATSLYNAIGITIGLEIAQNITGTLVEISFMCFVVGLYHARQQECGIENINVLPELKDEDTAELSITKLEIIACSGFAVLIAALYLITVNTAKKDDSILLDMFGRTEIVAHKGYSSRAPENTMPAFKIADEDDKVTFIELDVWSSKDGVPVVIHNKTINDATGIDRNIYDCTYEELKKIPAPYKWDIKEFPDARIPSLEEVISKYADNTPLIIEIKGYDQDPQLPAKIVELMKKYGCEDTSIIHSGNYDALKAVKYIDSSIKCGLILAVVTGNYYDIPYADFFSVEHTFVNQDQVAEIHRRGKDVYAWTVNYDTSADNLRFSDVDGIITDVPDAIYNYVSNSNDLVDNVVASNALSTVAESDIDKAFERFENGDY